MGPGSIGWRRKRTPTPVEISRPAISAWRGRASGIARKRGKSRLPTANTNSAVKPKTWAWPWAWASGSQPPPISQRNTIPSRR
jgi:hypothetical protein